MSRMHKLCDLLDEYADFWEKLRETNQQKLQAITHHELEVLEQSLAVQQAMAMQLDNFENRRIGLQKEAGLGAMTLQELIDACDDSVERAQLETARTRIESAVRDVRFYNAKAMEVARTHLRMLADLAPQNERAETRSYNAARERTGGDDAVIFQTKI